MYKIVYEKRVFKDLDKIPKSDLEKVINTFQGLSFSPYPVGCKKLSGREGLYRVKQGDYRIVYTVEHKDKEIKIVLVLHRKDAYRQLK